MATPKKRSEYGKAAEADINTQVELVDNAGRALEDLKTLEADFAVRIERGRAKYAEAYQAALDGGWKAPQLTRYRLPTPKAVAAGRYDPPKGSKTTESTGRPDTEEGRPTLAAVPDNPDSNNEN